MTTILVVDDQKQLRDRVCEYLQGTGASIKTAADGPEALRMISQDMPDVVISDIHMPGLNGLKLGPARRRSPPPKRAVPVSLTGNVSARDVAEGISVGA